MIVLVIVQHCDLVTLIPGTVPGDQGPGDDVNTGVGGSGGGGVVSGGHAQILSQVQVGGGQGGGGQGELRVPTSTPAHIHGPGHGGRARGGRVLAPLVYASPPCVHEEVGDSGGVEAELSGDGDLHLLAGTLGLLKREVRGYRE